jgi:hypothetical protein
VRPLCVCVCVLIDLHIDSSVLSICSLRYFHPSVQYPHYFHAISPASTGPGGDGSVDGAPVASLPARHWSGQSMDAVSMLHPPVYPAYPGGERDPDRFHASGNVVAEGSSSLIPAVSWVDPYAPQMRGLRWVSSESAPASSTSPAHFPMSDRAHPRAASAGRSVYPMMPAFSEASYQLNTLAQASGIVRLGYTDGPAWSSARTASSETSAGASTSTLRPSSGFSVGPFGAPSDAVSTGMSRFFVPQGFGPAGLGVPRANYADVPLGDQQSAFWPSDHAAYGSRLPEHEVAPTSEQDRSMPSWAIPSWVSATLSHPDSSISEPDPTIAHKSEYSGRLFHEVCSSDTSASMASHSTRSAVTLKESGSSAGDDDTAESLRNFNRDGLHAVVSASNEFSGSLLPPSRTRSESDTVVSSVVQALGDSLSGLNIHWSQDAGDVGGMRVSAVSGVAGAQSTHQA